MTVVSATTSASGSDQSGGAATGNAATPSIFLPTATQLTARRGEDATFSVRIAPGAATPTVYSWKKGRLGKEDDIVGGAPVDRYRIAENNNVISLTLHHVTCDDAGVYTLVAKGEPGGEDLRSAPMELSVLDAEEDEEDGASGVASGMDKGEKPVFLRTLSDLAVKVGTRTRFLVEIRSSSELKVRWLHGERHVTGVANGDPAMGVQDDEEASRFRLLHEGNFFCVDVSPVTPADGGKWTCVAENRGGRSLCSSYLNVLIPKAYKAPQFLEELRAVLTESGTVSLECKVVGVPTPLLRWYKDGRRIRAGDVFALTAAAAQDDPSSSLGTYTCEAVNCMGRAKSSSRVSVVTSKEDAGGKTQVQQLQTSGPPPVFEDGLRNEMVKIGESVTLSCKVRVPPWPRSVEWYSGSRRVDTDANVEGVEQRYRAIEDGMGKYSLEIKPLEACDDGEWKIVVTADNGATATSKAHVCMSIPKNYRKPRFLEALRAILSEEGLVSFECKVVGFPTPQLHWYKDGHELKPGDVYQLTGTNSLGSYSCIARNCMGEASSSAELTVEDIRAQLDEEERRNLISGDKQPPKFIRGLVSCEAKINEPFRFTVQVTISPEPKITWYRDDMLVEESTKYRFAKEVLGAFHLDINPLEIEDQAEWKCMASSENGESLTACFLRLIVPRHYRKPRFLECLRAILSEEGSVNLECKVIGVPQPTLTWYKDGKELKAGDIHRITSGTSGDGTCCLGTYTCEARNCMGVVASSASLLGFEERATVKGAAGAGAAAAQEGPRIARYPSLSTIHEERTSQLHDSQPSASMATAIGDEEEAEEDGRAEISFSFDGREVSVSLYETPDLTEEEALQIVEMFAEELSEHVSEHNVVDLPSLRFVKESSASGNILMEAVVIDVPVPTEDTVLTEIVGELRTEADLDEFSITEEILSSSGRTLGSPLSLPTSPASPESPPLRDPFDAAFLERALAPTVPYWRPGSDDEAEAKHRSSEEASFHTASQATKERMAAAARKLSDSLKAAESAEDEDDETFASARGSSGNKYKDEVAFQVQAMEQKPYLETTFDAVSDKSRGELKRGAEESEIDVGRPLKTRKSPAREDALRLALEEEESYRLSSVSELNAQSKSKTQAKGVFETRRGMMVEEQMAFEGVAGTISERESVSQLKTKAEGRLTSQMGIATLEQQTFLEAEAERSFREGISEMQTEPIAGLVSQMGIAIAEQQAILEAEAQASIADGISGLKTEPITGLVTQMGIAIAEQQAILEAEARGSIGERISDLKTEAEAGWASQMGVAVAEQQQLLEDRGKSLADVTRMSKKEAAAHAALVSQRGRAFAQEEFFLDAGGEPISESDSLWQLETMASHEEVPAYGVAVAEQQATLEAGLESMADVEGMSEMKTKAHSGIEPRKDVAVGGQEMLMETGADTMSEWSALSDLRTQAMSTGEAERGVAVVEQQAPLEGALGDISAMTSMSQLKTKAKKEQATALGIATVEQQAALEAGELSLSDKTTMSQLQTRAMSAEESQRGVGVVEEQALLEAGLQSMTETEGISKKKTTGLLKQEPPRGVAMVEQQVAVEEGADVSAISGISKLQTLPIQKESDSFRGIAVGEQVEAFEAGGDTLSDRSSLTGLETFAQGLVESEKGIAVVKQRDVVVGKTEHLTPKDTVAALEEYAKRVDASTKGVASAMQLALLEAKALCHPDQNVVNKIETVARWVEKSAKNIASILHHAVLEADGTFLSHISTITNLQSLAKNLEQATNALTTVAGTSTEEGDSGSSSIAKIKLFAKSTEESVKAVALLMQQVPLETSLNLFEERGSVTRVDFAAQNIDKTVQDMAKAIKNAATGVEISAEEIIPHTGPSELITVAEHAESVALNLSSVIKNVKEETRKLESISVSEIFSHAKSVEESTKAVATVLKTAVKEDASPDHLDVATISQLEAHALIVEESARNIACVYSNAVMEAEGKGYSKDLAVVAKQVEESCNSVAKVIKQAVAEADISSVMKKYCVMKLKNLGKDLEESSHKIAIVMEHPDSPMEVETLPSSSTEPELQVLAESVQNSAKYVAKAVEQVVEKAKKHSDSDKRAISQLVSIADSIGETAKGVDDALKRSASESSVATVVKSSEMEELARCVERSAINMARIMDEIISTEEVIDFSEISNISRLESLAMNVDDSTKCASTVIQQVLLENQGENLSDIPAAAKIVSVAKNVEETAKYVATVLNQTIMEADISSVLKKYSILKLENATKMVEGSALKLANAIEQTGLDVAIPEKVNIFKVEEVVQSMEESRKSIATVLEQAVMEAGAQPAAEASPLSNLVTIARSVEDSVKGVATVLQSAVIKSDVSTIMEDEPTSHLISLAHSIDETAKGVACILKHTVMDTEEAPITEQESVSHLVALAKKVDESATGVATVLKAAVLESERPVLSEKAPLSKLVTVAQSLEESAKCVAVVLQQAVVEADVSALPDKSTITELESLAKAVDENAKKVANVIEQTVLEADLKSVQPPPSKIEAVAQKMEESAKGVATVIQVAAMETLEGKVAGSSSISQLVDLAKCVEDSAKEVGNIMQQTAVQADKGTLSENVPVNKLVVLAESVDKTSKGVVSALHQAVVEPENVSLLDTENVSQMKAIVKNVEDSAKCVAVAIQQALADSDVSFPLEKESISKLVAVAQTVEESAKCVAKVVKQATLEETAESLPKSNAITQLKEVAKVAEESAKVVASAIQQAVIEADLQEAKAIPPATKLEVLAQKVNESAKEIATIREEAAVEIVESKIARKESVSQLVQLAESVEESAKGVATIIQQTALEAHRGSLTDNTSVSQLASLARTVDESAKGVASVIQQTVIETDAVPLADKSSVSKLAEVAKNVEESAKGVATLLQQATQEGEIGSVADKESVSQIVNVAQKVEETAKHVVNIAQQAVFEVNEEASSDKSSLSQLKAVVRTAEEAAKSVASVIQQTVIEADVTSLSEMTPISKLEDLAKKVQESAKSVATVLEEAVIEKEGASLSEKISLSQIKTLARSVEESARGVATVIEQAVLEPETGTLSDKESISQITTLAQSVNESAKGVATILQQAVIEADTISLSEKSSISQLKTLAKSVEESAKGVAVVLQQSILEADSGSISEKAALKNLVNVAMSLEESAKGVATVIQQTVVESDVRSLSDKSSISELKTLAKGAEESAKEVATVLQQVVFEPEAESLSEKPSLSKLKTLAEEQEERGKGVVMVSQTDVLEEAVSLSDKESLSKLLTSAESKDASQKGVVMIEQKSLMEPGEETLSDVTFVSQMEAISPELVSPEMKTAVAHQQTLLEAGAETLSEISAAASKFATLAEEVKQSLIGVAQTEIQEPLEPGLDSLSAASSLETSVTLTEQPPLGVVEARDVEVFQAGLKDLSIASPEMTMAELKEESEALAVAKAEQKRLALQAGIVHELEEGAEGVKVIGTPAEAALSAIPQEVQSEGLVQAVKSSATETRVESSAVTSTETSETDDLDFLSAAESVEAVPVVRKGSLQSFASVKGRIPEFLSAADTLSQVESFEKIGGGTLEEEDVTLHEGDDEMEELAEDLGEDLPADKVLKSETVVSMEESRRKLLEASEGTTAEISGQASEMAAVGEVTLASAEASLSEGVNKATVELVQSRLAKAESSEQEDLSLKEKAELVKKEKEVREKEEEEKKLKEDARKKKEDDIKREEEKLKKKEEEKKKQEEEVRKKEEEAKKKEEEIIRKKEEEKKREEEERKEKEEKERIKKEEEEKKRKEEDAKIKKEEEAKRKKAEEEQKKKDEEAKVKREEEEAKKKKEEEEKKKKEEEVRKKKEEEERVKKEEEEKKKKEEEAKRKKEEEEKKKKEEEARKKKEEERIRKEEEEKKKKEEEERIRREEEEKKKKEEEARRIKEEEEKRKLEEEGKRKKEEEEKKKREEEARKKKEEEERIKREEEEKKKKEEEARKKKEEEERIKREEEEKKKKEEEARKKKEEEERIKREEEEKKKKEEEARKKKEEEERIKREEEEKKRKEEEARKKKEEEERIRKEEEERKKKEEEEKLRKEEEERKKKEIEAKKKKEEEEELKRKKEEEEKKKKEEEKKKKEEEAKKKKEEEAKREEEAKKKKEEERAKEEEKEKKKKEEEAKKKLEEEKKKKEEEEKIKLDEEKKKKEKESEKAKKAEKKKKEEEEVKKVDGEKVQDDEAKKIETDKADAGTKRKESPEKKKKEKSENGEKKKSKKKDKLEKEGIETEKAKDEKEAKEKKERKSSKGEVITEKSKEEEDEAKRKLSEEEKARKKMIEKLKTKKELEKDGVPVANGSASEEIDGSAFEKEPSKPSVWETVLAPTEEKIERIDVMYRKKPRFESHLTDRTEMIGSSVKLTCNVVGNPDPQITWKKDGQPLSMDKLLKDGGRKAKRKYETSLKDGGIATLIILNCDASDSGEYACVARNEHGETVTKSEVRIYDPEHPEEELERDRKHQSEEDIAARAEAVAAAVAREDAKRAEYELRLREMQLTSERRRSLPPLYRAAVKAADMEEVTFKRYRSPAGYVSPAAPWEPLPRDSSLERPWPTHDHDDAGWMEVPKMKRRHRTPVIFDAESHEKLERITSSPYWGMAPDYTSSTRLDSYMPPSDGRRRSWSHGRPAMFVERPVKEVDVGMGEDAVVSFRVTGEPRPRVTWQKGTRDVTDGSRSLRETLDDYVRLTLKRVMIADAGTYHVIIRNAYGTDRAFFTIRVRQKARSLTPTRAAEWASSLEESEASHSVRLASMMRNIQDQRRDRTRMSDVPGPIGGEPIVTDSGRNWVTLSWPKPKTKSESAPVLAYKVEAWLVGEGARWVELGMSPIASFDAFGLQGGREYLFRVTPRNRYGWGESVTTSTPVALGKHMILPEFISILPGQIKALRGMDIKLECQARGDPIPEIRWYRDGFLLSGKPEDGEKKVEERSEDRKRLQITFDGSKCALSIKEVRESDTARYMCEASNTAGRVSTFARLLVVTDPKVWAADGKLRKWRMQSVGRDGEGDGEVVGRASVSALEDGDLTCEFPPQFTMRLRDRRVQMTYPVRLTCQVAGNPNPDVVWHKDGKLINPEEDERWAITSDEERFHTLELSRAIVEDSGEISATAQNAHGSVSCRCRLVVDKGIRAYVAPEFLFPLEGEVGPGGGPVASGEEALKVPEGGEIRLLTHVEAYPSVGIMWHRDGVRLRPRRLTVMTLDHDGRVELVVASATARDSGLYECTATNEVGRSTTSLRVAVVPADGTSQSATSSLRPIPSLVPPHIPYSKVPMFLTKPRSTEAEEGDTVIIHCEVIGDPRPEVIWLRDWLKPDYYRDAPHFRCVGGGPEGEEGEAGGGGHEYRLEIPCARLDYTGAYSVIARNCHGEAKAVISLQIYAKGQGMEEGSEPRTIRHGRVSTLPWVVRPLRDIRCCDGDAVTLECQVQATPPPLIRWEKGGKVLPVSSEGVYRSDWDPSTGRARLSIVEVYPEDEGEYSCIAFNDLGKAYTSACLLVDVPEEKENLLTRQLTRPPGLLLSAASTPRSTPRATPRATPSRSKSPSIPPRRSDSESRRILGSALVHPRHLRVTAPKFYAVPHNRVAEEGETVRFTCAIAGHPLPWASWDKDGVRITPTARISLSEKDDLRLLTISEVTLEDAGLYRVTLENEVGRVEASARLDVIGSAARRCARGGVRAWSASPRRAYSPSYYSRRLAPTTTRVGGRAAFACDIRSTSPYGGAGWLRNGEPIKESSRVRTSRRGRTAMLELKDVSVEDAGEYTCRLLVSDGKTEEGEEFPSTSARLTVLEADDPSEEDRRSPVFVEELTDSVAKEGEQLELSVRLTGTGPIDVIWSKEGRELPDCPDFRYSDLGEGRFVLRLADVFYPQDAGSFSCTAINAFGTAVSSAYLTVLPECGNVEECSASGGNVSNSTEEEKSSEEERTPPRDKATHPSPKSALVSSRRIEEPKSSQRESSEKTVRPKALKVTIAPGHGGESEEEEVVKKVESPARLTNGPSDTVALLGEKTRLCAYFTGNPPPTVRWLKGGRELGVGNDERVRVETTTGLSCLYLSAITADDSGKYVVSVENSLGSDCHFASLAVQGPPDPPGGRPMVRRTGTGRGDLNSAVVTWSSSPYDGGRIVTSFCVEMKRVPLTDSSKKEVSDDEEEWEVVAQRCHSLSLVVTDLRPGEDHIFRVRAANVHGLSQPSAVSLPYRPPVTSGNGTDAGRQKFVSWENGDRNGLANGALNENSDIQLDSVDAKGRSLFLEEEDDEDNADFSPPFEPRIVSLEPGTEFREQYEVLEELGKGRYGVVHRVQEGATGQVLAAKFIRCVKAKDREKVREEVDIMNCLRHPKLLQLAAAFESPREVVMVMEYISGGELFERVVADDFTLTERDCILFMRQICEGVEYMHSQNIVHLDLKPENIMCRTRTSHQIKLIDFGLAKKLNPNEPVRVLFGTPEFIPPEIINYEPIGVASDMWSVGVVCYVLLSGLSPFMGDNDAETFANITRADFDFEDEAFEAISDDAKDFISSLLIKRKEKRLTASQCLQHPWITSLEKTIRYVRLSTDKLKKFIIRRKWQKTGNAIRALGRMATLSARRNSTMVSSPGSQATTTSSFSSPGGAGPRSNINDPHPLPRLSEVPKTADSGESAPNFISFEGFNQDTCGSEVNWDGSIRSPVIKNQPLGRSRLCSERSDSGISDCSVSAGCTSSLPGQQSTECSVISEAEEEEVVKSTTEGNMGESPVLSSFHSKDNSSVPSPNLTVKSVPLSPICCSSSATQQPVDAAATGGKKTDGLRQQSSVDSGVHVDVAVGRGSRLVTSRKGVVTQSSSDKNRLLSRESPKKNVSPKVMSHCNARRKADSPPQQQLSANVHNNISKNPKSAQPVWK